MARGGPALDPWDAPEFARWLRQAEHTLESARRDVAEADLAWGAFKAQQAAEFALKALLRGLGQPAMGHSVRRLLEEVRALRIAPPPELSDAARRLEMHYIPSRYPDAYPEGSPFEFYTPDVAAQALDDAQATLAFVRGTVPPNAGAPGGADGAAPDAARP